MGKGSYSQLDKDTFMCEQGLMHVDKVKFDQVNKASMEDVEH